MAKLSTIAIVDPFIASYYYNEHRLALRKRFSAMILKYYLKGQYQSLHYNHREADPERKSNLPKVTLEPGA